MYWANHLVRACTLTLAVLAIGSSVLRQPIALSKQAVQPRTRAIATLAATALSRTRQVAVQAAYGKLPLQFEANQGQSDEQVRFLARGSGYTLFLTATEAVLALLQKPESRRQESEVKSSDSSPKTLQLIPKPHPWMPASAGMTRMAAGSVIPAQAGIQSSGEKEVLGQFVDARLTLRMQLVGANPQPYVTGEAELPGKANYFFSNDPIQWHTNIPTYARVKYEGVYPGVDLIYYGTQQQLEYDFVVAPGADPKIIRVAFNSVGAGREPPPHIDTTGDLVLNTGNSELRFHQPHIYQDINGSKQSIAGRYVLLDSETADSGLRTQQIGFAVAAYDTTKPLIIDPVLVYSTFLGGSNSDGGTSIAVDASGNAYVTGTTTSIDFPTANPLQPNPGDPSDRPYNRSDVFVTKLNAAGTALIYSTYIGGSDIDIAQGIAVDSIGNAYLTGFTYSQNFPTTQSLQPTAGVDAFVLKLNATGSALVYSTRLGGSDDDNGNSIAVDRSGNTYVTGYTRSIDFPSTTNAFRLTCNFNDSANCYDAFVAKLDSIGSTLVYSTYLGGSTDDAGFSIAVDGSGNAYVTGGTHSLNFPTTDKALETSCRGRLLPEGCTDAFVTKLNAAGSALLYSTYLGGAGFEQGLGIAVDSVGNAYITGATGSEDFPTVNPLQSALHPPPPDCDGCPVGDVFVAKLDPTGSTLVYATYLGGDGFDAGLGIAVDTAGNAYVTGSTESVDFPMVNALNSNPSRFQTKAFVAKLQAVGSAFVYSTSLGGSVRDSGRSIAVDPAGNTYVIGSTFSSDFPTVQPVQPAFDGGQCISLSLIICSDAFVTKITSEVQAFFESPENGPVSGISAIRGWAFATEPDVSISSVELFIDGQSAGEVPCCSQRGDVQAAFPQFPADDTLNSGWGRVVNWGLLGPGSHTVLVKIQDTAGDLFLTELRTVNVVKPGDSEFLDQFSLAEATASIARLNDRPGNELIVEGIVVRDKVTQQQKQINARFRWFESSQSFGMVGAETVAEVSSLRSLFSSLLASLSVRLSGITAVANAQVDLRSPFPQAHFDEPEPGQEASGIGAVRGWAFYPRGNTPLKNVWLSIDEQPAGTIPCCSDRADVAAAFPDNPNALHSGWGIAFNYGLLSPGRHIFKVEPVQLEGVDLYFSHSVWVVQPGGFEFLDRFDLSEATARVVQVHPWSLPDREEIRLEGVKVRDKISQQEKVITVHLRWFVSSQALGIVSSSD